MSDPLLAHDLVLLSDDDLPARRPVWATSRDGETWAVVRRLAPAAAGAVPVGLRGPTRAARFGCDIDPQTVRIAMVPEQLSIADPRGIPQAGIRTALDRLAGFAPTWSGHRAWGPVGSVGYQLATGIRAVHDTSDLDLLIRTVQPMAPMEAAAILALLQALPCRTDCVLETPAGGVALSEWAISTGRPVLLRTGAGPRLTTDPWSAPATDPNAQLAC